jgi:Fuc2NAc and GlcNAc transferase
MFDARAASVAALSGLAAYLLTFAVRWITERRGVFDVPNHRSSHTRVTPRGGGVAIMIVFSAWLLVASSGLQILPWPLAWALLGGSTVLVIVSLADDRAGLPASVRLAVHFTVVALALIAIPGSVAYGGGIGLAAWFALVAVACVWFLNLFNFMDGIDGIAAMEAAFVSLAAAFLTSWLGAPVGLVWTWLALAGASIGFLVHNWSPATIFMGDSGSGFLGFALATMLVASTAVTGFSPWTAAILVAAFGSDATTTLVRRICRGQRWSEAHRSHVYQQLARRHASHPRVTTGYLLLNVMLILPVAALSVRHPQFAPALASGLYLLLCAVAWKLGAGTDDTPERKPA